MAYVRWRTDTGSRPQHASTVCERALALDASATLPVEPKDRP
jgi:hypothetical protein